MSDNGIHFMALPKAKARLVENENELKVARVKLEDAIKFRDLRENSEYDEARDNLRRLNLEREQLLPVIGMSVIKSSDDLQIIEEGSVLDIKVYSITETPVATGSAHFEELKKGEPIFSGIVMYGGTLKIHELLEDNALSINTPVGRFIYGKVSGDYSVPVNGGFVNISVAKLSSNTDADKLYTRL